MPESKEWPIGKCIVTDLYIPGPSENDYEVVYEVRDCSGEWLGRFPTLMRAINYAKRENWDE